MANGWSLMAMTSIERLGRAVKRFDTANANATSRSRRDAVPGDDVVLAYVSHGALARYVEDIAQQNPAFGEELAACIDALAETGPRPSIAPAARRWRTNWPPPKKESSSAREECGTAPARQPAKIVHIAARRVWPMVFAATVLLAVGGGSLAYKQNQIRTAARATELAEQEARLAELMKELELANQAIAEAQVVMANAGTEAERAEAQARLEVVKQEQMRTRARMSSARGAAGAKPTPRPACTCLAGDPLCSCL
jgi:hypothetical protein